MARSDVRRYYRKREPALLKVLAPSDSLSEIVYGIITALAVTNALWFTLGSKESDAVVITATLLINAAWGLSDSIVYLLRASVEKSAAYGDLHALKEMDEKEAKVFIEDNLAGTIVSSLEPLDKEKVVADVYKFSTRTKPIRARLDKWDYVGAIASFVLYVISAIPILLPHIFLMGISTPLVIGNIIGVILMFLIGFVWAGRMRGPRYKAGVIMAISGVVMIIVITLVGG